MGLPYNTPLHTSPGFIRISIPLSSLTIFFGDGVNVGERNFETKRLDKKK